MVTTSDKTNSFERSIFVTGEYINHFKPENKQNPFSKIYTKKKQDTIDFILHEEDKNTILDIGGGMGRLAFPLAQSGKKEVTLSDISVDMLKLAANQSEGYNHVRFINADAHDLPFRDKLFDIVVGLDLFCHLHHPQGALKEFNRILKNTGLLIIDSTNSNPFWTFFYPRYVGKNPINWIKTLKFKGVLPGWETIVRHYTKKVFYSFIGEAGFEVIKTMNYGPKVCSKWHLVVAKKKK